MNKGSIAAKMGNVRQTLKITLATWLALCISGSAGAGSGPERHAIRLTVFDEVACPGESVTMRPKLEHAGPFGIHLHMRGYSLHFSYPPFDGQDATTREEAMASVTVKVPPGAVG